MNSKVLLFFVLSFLGSTITVNAAFRQSNRPMLREPKDSASRRAVEKEWQKKCEKHENKKAADQQAAQIELSNLYKRQNNSNK